MGKLVALAPPKTTSKKKTSAILLLAVTVMVSVAATLTVRNRPVTLRGAIVRKSDQPARDVPVGGVQVTASDGSVVAAGKSDSSGAFALTLPRSVIRRKPMTLNFRHPDYVPYELSDAAGGRLYVVSMTPLPGPAPVKSSQPQIRIGNVSVRYTVKTGGVMDVGSGVKTFQVVNTGNVPCNGHAPCSPDGKWKAGIGGATLDAGPENVFRDGRVSCIAGPCPFTAIQHDNFSRGGRVISVSVLNWSDTTTFLLQAEAVREMLTDTIRKSYPVVYEDTMNFSLPASAEGTCIEAEVDGTPIVFPIVPNLSLSWANCETQAEPENNKLYRCELKPGYLFQ